jgi:hypothetical protein
MAVSKVRQHTTLTQATATSMMAAICRIRL